ncbi:MAG TPA: DegQ family serine endoprotease, partial [Burkholderiales bacterium]|nr:DegQ family serine endoprotease [Burkholderiales bacterium]
MNTDRRSFRVGLIAGLFLFAGVIVGVVMSSRLSWMPAAGSAESTTARAPMVAAGPNKTFVPVVKAVTPAVVNISTTRVVKSRGGDASPLMDDPFFRQFFGEEFFRRFQIPRERRENSLGSGVIVSSDGYIVTNNHVIAKADEIKVLMNDKREFVGKVVGTDPKTDLAVVKIDARDLPNVPWGDSDKLEVGEYVLAVGNPFALSSTVTMGIVSAVGRANVGIADYEDFIQTDAAINPGNSGGALVNAQGELVGINTAIFSRSGGSMGIGFAVPANMVHRVMDSLIKSGKVTRGWLGVSIQDVTKDLAKQFGLGDANGALVSEVLADSPAASAGLKSGDVIVGFDGKPVESPAVLRNVVAQTAVGKTVKVDVLRDKKRRSFNIRIVEQPKEIAQAGTDDETPGSETGGETALSGLEARNLTPDIAQQLGLPATVAGVVITGVSPDSAAADAGVQPGDVVLEVNRKVVRSVTDLKRINGKLSKSESVLLLINRRGG